MRSNPKYYLNPFGVIFKCLPVQFISAGRKETVSQEKTCMDESEGRKGYAIIYKLINIQARNFAAICYKFEVDLSDR